MTNSTRIADDSRGSNALPRSPVTIADFELMKQTVTFGPDDVEALRVSAAVLRDQVDAILDVWYGFVGSHPHLLASFSNPADGQPIGPYLDAVRKRFGQWILDTARADYGQEWLDYQHEIALRHHRAKKNVTDGAPSTDLVPFRDIFLLLYPVTATLRPFLAKDGNSEEEVDRMAAAWLKSCLLQLTLWSYPYVKEGDF